MFRTLFLLSILLDYCPAVKGQEAHQQDSGDLEWSSLYKLRWEDYQGRRPAHSHGDAGTSVTIRAKPYLFKGKIMYDVTVIFNKEASWSVQRSEALLAHEQLHFDIAELYGRKIRKKVAELQDRRIRDIRIYHDAISSLLEESNVADRRYDAETLHGALSAYQLKWQASVRKQLTDFKDYQKTSGALSAR